MHGCQLNGLSADSWFLGSACHLMHLTACFQFPASLPAACMNDVAATSGTDAIAAAAAGEPLLAS